MSDPTSNEKTQNHLPSECPMSSDYAGQNNTNTQTDVINSDIDQTNMMPPPNQRPSQDQPFELSKERVSSSIPKFAPKGKQDNTWQYPSPQMFWNAMTRKGWRWQDDEVEQSDINNIISIHNVNNERAWREILMWERAYHENECKWQDIKLKKFSGKAKEFTWRAKIRNIIYGYPLPFDRHDWIIDRCGKERTYIIDYYSGSMNEETMQFTDLDVRPHPRNTTDYWWPEALADRSRTFYRRKWVELKEKISGNKDYLTPNDLLDTLKAVNVAEEEAKNAKTPTVVNVNPAIGENSLGKIISNPHVPLKNEESNS